MTIPKIPFYALKFFSDVSRPPLTPRLAATTYSVCVGGGSNTTPYQIGSFGPRVTFLGLNASM